LIAISSIPAYGCEYIDSYSFSGIPTTAAADTVAPVAGTPTPSIACLKQCPFRCARSKHRADTSKHCSWALGQAKYTGINQYPLTSMSESATHGLTEEQVADLKEAFAMFDINGDGTLSPVAVNTMTLSKRKVVRVRKCSLFLKKSILLRRGLCTCHPTK
jgi:hypothetical protein